MPVDALPQPHGASVPGVAHVRREYRDPLGRAMSGKVTFARKATEPIRQGVLTVPIVPVTLRLADGVVEADLPLGTYTVTAELQSADSQKATVRDEITLESE